MATNHIMVTGAQTDTRIHTHAWMCDTHILYIISSTVSLAFTAINHFILLRVFVCVLFAHIGPSPLCDFAVFTQ